MNKSKVDNYTDFIKELKIKQRTPEEYEQVKTDIANGKYDKDEVVGVLYDTEQ